MDFFSSIELVHFRFKGCLKYFSFLFRFNRAFCNQTVESDQVLNCLAMSHKKDARLIWIKIGSLTCCLGVHKLTWN